VYYFKIIFEDIPTFLLRAMSLMSHPPFLTGKATVASYHVSSFKLCSILYLQCGGTLQDL